MATSSKTGGGSRAKLRVYFLANLGRVMDSNELREVAGGISEWARRVRELRTEEGYLILTHNDRADLKPGQYLLESAKPQPAFAREISKETRLCHRPQRFYLPDVWRSRWRTASLRP